MTAGFLQGLVLGFSIAAPVGPIGVLCIRRTLTEGRAAGLLTGLGAATADAMYGSIAAFGLTALSGLLVEQGDWLRPAGAIVMGFLGLRFLVSKPAASAPSRLSSLGGAYVTSIFLTLTNPLTILSFAAAYAGLGLGTRTTHASGAAMMVGGVFTGSCLWWLTLTTLVGAFRSRLNSHHLVWVNRASGGILLLFAIVLLAAR